MNNKSPKKNILKYILSLPFLGIFYVVDFFLKIVNWILVGLFTLFKPLIIFFKYVSLGCYYTLYVVLFPIIYVVSKIVDAIYAKNHNDNEISTINIEEFMPDENGEAVSEQTEEAPKQMPEEKLSFREKLIARYNDFYFVKAQREKEEKQVRDLIRDIQKNNYRSEKPLVFRYVVRDPSNNKKITNLFIAYSKLEVLTYLQSEGYKVLKIETSKWLNIIHDPNKASSANFKTKDLIFWLTQLSTYLKAGIPLTQAMQILSKQMSKDKAKKRLFDSIVYHLTLGESFSNALTKQGKSFPALLISMIKTAEATGKLEETLDDMADYYTEIENTRKAMISAMSYPAIISVFSIIVITFIMLYIIPQFENVYAQAGAQINSFTLTLISLSKFLKANLLKILLVLALIVLILIMLYKKVKQIKKIMQEIAMKLPLFGKIIIYKEMNVFTKTFSSLLQNNVFITESMNLLSEVTSNEIYRDIMFKTIYYIAKGDKISTAFKDHWAIPDVAYYMIVTGESTGELATMMSKVADYYATEHKSIINNLKAFIEPAMIIILAVIVGGVVIAVILPMFKMYSQIM